MFWKRLTMEDVIRRAMEAGVTARGGYHTSSSRPFKWTYSDESVEDRLRSLTDLAVQYRQSAREYRILYPRGGAYALNTRLDEFLADESFKKNILQEAEAREVEVQKSRAMVEAVRAGKDRHPGFLRLVEAETLKDIESAKRFLARSLTTPLHGG